MIPLKQNDADHERKHGGMVSPLVPFQVFQSDLRFDSEEPSNPFRRFHAFARKLHIGSLTNRIHGGNPGCFDGREIRRNENREHRNSAGNQKR